MSPWPQLFSSRLVGQTDIRVTEESLTSLHRQFPSQSFLVQQMPEPCRKAQISCDPNRTLGSDGHKLRQNQPFLLQMHRYAKGQICGH